MKILKLALIALVIVGAIVGLAYINSGGDTAAEPEFTSAQAKIWKEKIKALCQEGKWTAGGYNKIETGIHTDRVASKGSLITIDEELALHRYLFASSCCYLKNGTDKLFKQNSYPQGTVDHYEAALSTLRGKSASQGNNSNLTDASNLFAAYHQLLNMLKSNTIKASYSHPLRAFSGDDSDQRKARIKNSTYYKSHFSNNPSLRAKVENLGKGNNSESEYYDRLERLVEQHYRQTNDIETLLEDQIRFDEISTNQSAKSRLNSFVNNPSN